jgi:lipopolysaccharide transport system permease protein
MKIKSFITLIDNNPKGLVQSFKNIFNNKFLIYSLVKKNILLSYSQSIVGPAYFIFLPLIQTIVLSFFLNNIFKLESNLIGTFIFIFISTTYWNFLTNTINKCSNSYLFNKRIITKVYFDRIIFFIQSLFLPIFNFVVSLFILIIVIILLMLTNKNVDVQLTYKIFFLPFFLFYSCFFSLFIGIIIASLSIRYRDLIYGLSFLFQILLFITPVLYPLEKLQGLTYNLMIFNPFTFFLEFFRWFFYPDYIMIQNVIIINVFYFLFLIIFANIFYKKSNLILSDEI